jgi:hypothetical protein
MHLRLSFLLHTVCISAEHNASAEVMCELHV